jgi:hypothetical protein
MNSTFICRQCQCHCQRNPRIKNQKYCSSATCQNARKRLHDKTSLSQPRGRALKKIRNQKWRDKRPAHEYQKDYRIAHPEYVKHNRELQRDRKKKHQTHVVPKIVKTDALSGYSLSDVAFVAFKVKKGKIVKTDALLLQMQTIIEREAVSALNSS